MKKTIKSSQFKDLVVELTCSRVHQLPWIFQTQEWSLGSSKSYFVGPDLDHSTELVPSDRELNKVACNISKFEPISRWLNLNGIDFYLQKFPIATTVGKIYLIKVI